MKKNKLIIILLLSVCIIIIYNVVTENMDEVKNTNIYDPSKLIELQTLTICDNNIITANYGINTNTINNDNISINNEITEPQLHSITVDGKDYYLTQFEWKKSKFSWDNNPIGLDLHLIHTDYIYNNSLKIILPLNLTDDYNLENITENFVNVLYKKMDDMIININDTVYSDLNNQIKILSDFKNNDIVNTVEKTINNKIKTINNNLYDLKIKYNFFNNKINNLKYLNYLNKLTDQIIHIPKYSCCSKTIGSIQTFYLCKIKNIINNIQNYYILEEQNGNKCFISVPIPFNTMLGYSILNNIISDPNQIYIKQ